jgi:recombination protein RecT
MTEESKELTKSEPKTIQSFLNVDKTKSYLEGILKERAPQFMTSLISMSNLTAGLTHCEPRSLMMCGLKAVSLNLPLDNNLGFAYAIPFKNNDKGITEATFMLGYRGLIQLALRTGQFRSVNIIDIREGELKTWDALTEKLTIEPIEDEKARERAQVIGYAAMFKLSNGFEKVIYRKKDTILAHGKRFSKTFSRGPWQSDQDAMCRKTLLKELLGRWAPLSTELMEGIKYDQSVIRQTDSGEEQPDYIDVQDITPVEKPTYNISESDLVILQDYFTILKVPEAEQSMKLAGCKGQQEAVDALKKSLHDTIINMEHAVDAKKDEGFLTPPEEHTEREPFSAQDKEKTGKKK